MTKTSAADYYPGLTTLRILFGYGFGIYAITLLAVITLGAMALADESVTVQLPLATLITLSLVILVLYLWLLYSNRKGCVTKAAAVVLFLLPLVSLGVASGYLNKLLQHGRPVTVVAICYVIITDLLIVMLYGYAALHLWLERRSQDEQMQRLTGILVVQQRQPPPVVTTRGDRKIRADLAVVVPLLPSLPSTSPSLPATSPLSPPSPPPTSSPAPPKPFLSVLFRSFTLSFQGRIDEECAICLANYHADDHVTQLICHHIFHTNCLTDYRHSTPDATCPLCRHPFA